MGGPRIDFTFIGAAGELVALLFCSRWVPEGPRRAAFVWNEGGLVGIQGSTSLGGRAGVAELVDAVALGATVLVTCRFESCPRYQKNPARVGRLMRRRPRPATLM